MGIPHPPGTETVPSGLVTVVVSQYEILSLPVNTALRPFGTISRDLGLSRAVRLGLERLTDCSVGFLFLRPISRG